MDLPNYKRPFEQADFRGHFTLSDANLTRLPTDLYHSTHFDHAYEAIEAGYLGLRSECHIDLPEFGMTRLTGIWMTLNAFNYGSFYGPISFSVNPKIFHDRKFIAFLREDDDGRLRYFFLQHDSEIPVFMKDGKPRRLVKIDSYFDAGPKNKFWLKDKAIYDFFITMPVPVANAQIVAEKHPKCISGTCKGSPLKDNEYFVKALAQNELNKTVAESADKYRERYPNLFSDPDTYLTDVADVLTHF